MKKIITVNGALPISECRMVLPHEHFFIDLTNQKAAGASLRPLQKSDHAQMMIDPYSMQDNLLMDDFQTAVNECLPLLEYGCNTAVDCTTPEISRNPEKLRALALKTNLNIVMGCGYYTADTHFEKFAAMSAEEACEDLTSQVINGENGIFPGIIGEIGTSKEILPDEEKALIAAAAAHCASNLAIQVHIYPWSNNGLKALDILTSHGVSPAKIVICHSDVEPCWDYIKSLLAAGVYVELDNFGKEFTPASDNFAGGNFIKDTERAELAAKIIDEGFGSQLLLANDICLKCMLSQFGGQGYTHIFENILPMIEKCGIDGNYLKNTVMRENPLNMLAG